MLVRRESGDWEMTDTQKRQTALTTLALKTQAHRWDDAVMAAYLDDPQMQAVPLPDFLTACLRLAGGEWFPKLGELMKACHAATAARLEADQQKFLALGSGNRSEPNGPLCSDCRDTGMIDSRWCDGSGEATDTSKRRQSMEVGWCGDNKPHRPHSWTRPCACWVSRTQAARDAYAARQAVGGDRQRKARSAWA
jgi:hypothetical protein